MNFAHVLTVKHCMSSDQCIYLSIHLSIYLSIYLHVSIYLSSVSLSLCLSVCLSIYLSAYLIFTIFHPSLLFLPTLSSVLHPSSIPSIPLFFLSPSFPHFLSSSHPHNPSCMHPDNFLTKVNTCSTVKNGNEYLFCLSFG